jgi:F-type H+-transporting ATPase subunit b
MKRMFRTTIGMMVMAAVLLLAGGAYAVETGPIKPGTEDVEKHTTTVKTASGGHGDHEEPKLIGGLSKGALPALTSLVVFILLLVVLGKFAWGPIASGLKAREDKIRKDIADAEAASNKAQATLRDYTAKLTAAEASAREIREKAVAEAAAEVARIKAQNVAEMEEAKEKNLRDIEAAKDSALREIYEETAVLATNVAEKILRRNLNANDQRDLVAQSLEQLQTVSKN